MHALLGTALVAASASIANQWWEREIDARMPRTADRPLPAGRVSSAEALCFRRSRWRGNRVAVWQVNLLTAALGWRVGSFTCDLHAAENSHAAQHDSGRGGRSDSDSDGLDRHRSAVEPDGVGLGGRAVPLAIPSFHGDCLVVSSRLCAAGHQMLPVVDPTGLRCAAKRWSARWLLIPISLIPALSSAGGSPLVYFVGRWSWPDAVGWRCGSLCGAMNVRPAVVASDTAVPAGLVGMLLMVTM